MNGNAWDVERLRDWVGNTETTHDVITCRIVTELRATLDYEGALPKAGEPAPLGIHWCLGPPTVKTAELGPDGHPARGGFLPPVALERRMWAGSTVRFEDRLRVGDEVERRSRIADITVKYGKTGQLCFVVVDHEIWSGRGLAIVERLNIVYRSAGPRVDVLRAEPVPLKAPSAATSWHCDMHVGPVTLFRYSALTFNGHRIHYDRTYAAREEGYPGLLVHGPLQATLLLNFAASFQGGAPKEFVCRGLKPLFDFMPFRLCGARTEMGLSLWIEDGNRVRTMEASAQW